MRRYPSPPPVVWTNLGVAAAPFSGTWAQFGGTTNQPAQYGIDANGMVHLRGHVSNSVGWAGVIATLPVGFRPALRRTFCMTAYGGGVGWPGSLQVFPDGTINWLNSPNSTWSATNFVSLDGISYFLS